MSQFSIASLGHCAKKKRTKCDEFLAKMDGVVPRGVARMVDHTVFGTVQVAAQTPEIIATPVKVGSNLTLNPRNQFHHGSFAHVRLLHRPTSATGQGTKPLPRYGAARGQSFEVTASLTN